MYFTKEKIPILDLSVLNKKETIDGPLIIVHLVGSQNMDYVVNLIVLGSTTVNCLNNTL